MVANQSSVIQQNVFRAKVTEPPSVDTICQCVCELLDQINVALQLKMLKSELFSTKDAKVDKGSDICGRRRKKFLAGKFFC